jgi:hypothetical protein
MIPSNINPVFALPEVTMQRISQFAVMILSVGLTLAGATSSGSNNIPVCLGNDFFIRNIGQYGPEILYYADLNCGRLYIRQNDIAIQLIEAGRSPNRDGTLSADLRILPDADPAERPGPTPRRLVNLFFQYPGADFSHVAGEGNGGPRLHILRGNNPALWRTDIPTVRQVRIRNLYPGIDLVAASEGSDNHLWHFEWTGSEPPPAPPRAEIRTTAARSERPDHIAIHTAFGDFLLKGNAQAGGWRRQNSSPPLSSSPGEALWMTKPEEARDPSPAIAQQIRWGTFVGGSTYDDAYSLATDAYGNVIFAGITGSSNIPAPGGYDGSLNGDEDFYIGKLSADGSQLLWATYLGGNYEDHLNALALGLHGEIIVCGKTTSEDMPVQNGYDMSYNGMADCYVAALSSTGDRLLFGTFLGGTSSEWLYAMTVAADGSIIIGGQTSSTDIPTPGGYDTTLNGYTNMYVAALSASGDQVLWGTYLGGSASDECYALALDSEGDVVVAGTASSPNIPTPGGYDTSLSSLYGMYVAKLNADGSDLLWGTFICGDFAERARSIALDPKGNVVVCGETCSTEMPVPGGYDTDMNGIYDFYLAKLSASGDRLLWGTYVGGTEYDAGVTVTLDPDGRVIFGGFANSTDMPASGGYDSTPNGAKDYFIAELSPWGDEWLWGTYLGGTGQDDFYRLLRTSRGDLLVAGNTYSSNMPVPGGFDRSRNGEYDCYIACLSDPTPRAGDVNADGRIDVADLMTLRHALVGHGSVATWQGDIYLDHRLDSTDVLILAQFLAERLPCLPVWP